MMDRNEAVLKLARQALISTAHAEDLYDSFFEKPVVPQFVADWIEYCKENNLTIIGAFDPVSELGIALAETYKGSVCRCTKWALDNQDTFARAWLDGYEVEEEAKYRIKMKAARYNGFPQFLCAEDRGIFWGPVFDCPKTKFTRKELEDANFGWVFNCEGIEIKEVE